MQRRNEVVRAVDGKQHLKNWAIKRIRRHDARKAQTGRESQKNKSSNACCPNECPCQTLHGLRWQEKWREQEQDVHREVEPDEFWHKRYVKFPCKKELVLVVTISGQPVCEWINTKKRQTDTTAQDEKNDGACSGKRPRGCVEKKRKRNLGYRARFIFSAEGGWGVLVCGRRGGMHINKIRHSLEKINFRPYY